MGSDFPVPRDELPRIEVTPLERDAHIGRYDEFRHVDQCRVDPRVWKLTETRDHLQLFRERHTGSSGTSSISGSSCDGFALTPAFSNSDDSSLDFDDPSSYVATSAAGLSDSTRKAMFLFGEMPGRVENAVYGVVTKSQSELAMVDAFLHDDVADCALLKTLEGPTRENPLQFLGYKWFAKKSLGGGRLVKHRDTLYLESCGLTTDARTGEKIGYLLIESVDLPSFPELTGHHCVRAFLSVRFLVRQKSNNVLEVFMRGTVEPSTGRMLRPFATMLTADNAFMIARVMELAETKRLTKMIVSQRHVRDERMYNRRVNATACSLCNQQSKFYNTVSLVDCRICGQAVCSRCRSSKRVFISDASLGRFHRVSCCRACILDANNALMTSTIATEDSTSEPPVRLQRQNRAQDQYEFTHSSRGMDDLDFYSSRSRSSSDSSMVMVDKNKEVVPMSSSIAASMAIASVRRGSVDRAQAQPLAAGNVRRYGPGVTLLPTSSLVRQDRGVDRNATDRGDRGYATLASMQHQQHQTRQRSGSTSSIDGGSSRRDAPSPSVGGKQQDIKTVAPPSASTARPALSFTESAPTGTYDLRRHTSAPQPPAAQPTHKNSLFAQMLELHRLAESTYQTTQQNHAYMQQHTPSHQHQQQQHGQNRRGFM